MPIDVTDSPDRKLSRECRDCHEPAHRWIAIGDDNLRVVVALCRRCSDELVSRLIEEPPALGMTAQTTEGFKHHALRLKVRGLEEENAKLWAKLGEAKNLTIAQFSDWLRSFPDDREDV